MPSTEFFMGAILTTCSTRVSCPTCDASFDAAPVFETNLPGRGYYTRSCRECGDILGVSTNTEGDAVCWSFAEEKSLKTKS